jgi:hypothetical protein
MAPLIAALFAQLTANPARLVLGQDRVAELQLRAPEGATVSITASVGSVGEVRREGGMVRARYQPPKANSPSVALLLAQIDRGGDRELQWLSLPLSGSDTMVIETRPGATVEAEVAGRTFGPVTADEKGMVTLRLVVPPGLSQGKLRITDQLGNTNHKPLDLDPPPFSRLRIAARGEAASATSPLDLEIFAVRPDGSPDDAARIELRAPAGGVEVLERIGHGVYLARYQPPRGRASGTVRLEAAASGQLASAQVQVRSADGRMGQWPSSLSTQKPWSVSLGFLGGGGPTFDGPTAGTVFLEAALRIEELPEELLLDIGPSFFSSVTQSGPGNTTVQAQPQLRIVQLGLRAGRELARGLDGYGTLAFGLQQQSVSIPGQPTQDSLSPRLTLGLGGNLRLGPGRALAQMQIDIAPATVSGLQGGLSGVQVLAGYLLTLR